MSIISEPLPLTTTDSMEVAIYVFASLILDLMSHSSLLATLGAKQSEEDMQNMIYNVNISWYSIDSIFSLFGSALRMGLAAQVLTTYITASEEVTDKNDLRFQINEFGIIGLVITMVLYLYKAIISIMNVMNFFVTEDTYVKIKFKDFNYYVEPDGEATFGLISYVINLVIGPSKASIMADIIAAVFTGFA